MPSPARDVPRISQTLADVERLARFLFECEWTEESLKRRGPADAVWATMKPHESDGYRLRARRMVARFDELEEIRRTIRFERF